MTKEYPADERGKFDAGEQIVVEKPCAVRCSDRWGNVTWCVQRDGHEGAHSDGR